MQLGTTVQTVLGPETAQGRAGSEGRAWGTTLRGTALEGEAEERLGTRDEAQRAAGGSQEDGPRHAATSGSWKRQETGEAGV